MIQEIKKYEITDIALITPRAYRDSRGYFMETYKKSALWEHIPYNFVQDNHSKSDRGILRGLHYQLKPAEQGKLVRVVRGSIFDVAVDIRKNSPTYGRYVGEYLSEENRRMLWVPPGFAHGFCTLENDTHVIYKVTCEYSPENERGIIYNDAEIGIEWPLGESELSLAERDKNFPTLDKAEVNFV